MIKSNQKKAKLIQQKLSELIPSPTIALHFDSPYTLLIAVLLSAQCTDKRVNLVTPHLFALADTPEKMAEVPVETIEKIIKSCGLAKRKAAAISLLSKKIAGKPFPKTFAALEALPGVGHKTASVVMAQAFQKPAFPVDTHIHRLAKRWGLTDAKHVKQTEADLKKLFPKTTWNTLHLQMITYGRTYCPARGHSIKLCPICTICHEC